MARWGNCDFKQLKEFQEKLEKIEKANTQRFCKDIAKELAARLLSKVIRRTPVGDYSHTITVIAKRDGKKHKKGERYTKKVNPSGKLGGTLRRGWVSKTEQEAKNGTGKSVSKDKIESCVDSLPIKHTGNTYQVDVTNIISYASYVELGHRTRGHNGWVEGKFMLTISEKEINEMLPKFIEKKLAEFINEVFK